MRTVSGWKKLRKSAQAWCQDETKHLLMQPELCMAFARILDRFVIEPDLERDKKRRHPLTTP